MQAPLSRREQDEILIFGEVQESSSTGGVWYDDEYNPEEFLERMTRPPGPPGPEFHQKLEAERLMWELLSRSRTPRPEEAIRQAPYRDFHVAKALLEQSERSVRKFDLPEQSRDRARLAEEIAKLLETEDLAKSWAMQAHARCLQANAERLLRHWPEAEERFRSAQSLLVELSEGAVHAVYYQQLAALLEDQGRSAEATVLLTEAERLFREEEIGGRATECLIQLGFLYLQRNDPGRAMAPLVEAEQRLPSLFFELLSRVKLGQAMCLAAAGLQELAREVKAESLRFRQCIHKSEDRVKAEWLECRIAVHLGELDTAIPRLEAICRWFGWYEEPCYLGQLCLCSVDLAYAYALAGQLLERWPDLVREIARQPGAGEEVWPLGALWRFREAVVTQSRDPVEAAREAAAFIYRREKSLAGLAPPAGTS